MRDLGLLVIRLVIGGLLAGHGAQKLFGWFGGYGLEGTGGWLETLGLRPGRWWAFVAGVGEFGGGLLTALGLFHPVGPIMTMGPMSVATTTVHANKPIWVSEGGAELPVTNMAIGIGLSLAGPGRYSLDRLLGTKMPSFLIGLIAFAVLVGLGTTMATRAAAQRLAPAAGKEPIESAETMLESDEETSRAA